MKLEIKGLQFSYDSNFKLEIEKLAITDNTIFSIIGPNGSGKSTLLKILAGIVNNYIGDIFLSGKSLKSYNISEIATYISYVNTYLSDVVPMKVIDVVSTGRFVYSYRFGILSNIDIKKVDEAMDIAEISDKKHYYINELSSGEIKRVLIARAIAQDTPILILDEPFANLDPRYSIKIMDIIKRLKKDKIIIMAIHDINIALLISDSLLALKNGSVFFLFDKVTNFDVERLQQLYEVDLKELQMVFLSGKFGENPTLSRNCDSK